jgi:hypothetical protein
VIVQNEKRKREKEREASEKRDRERKIKVPIKTFKVHGEMLSTKTIIYHIFPDHQIAI